MQTLRTLEALEREGLVAIDPRLADGRADRWRSRSRRRCWALIDRGDRQRPDRAPVRAERRRDRGRARGTGRPDRRRGALAGQGHRPPLSRPGAAEAVHVCPVYCRFCFRREKVGPGGEALSAAELEAALAYIRADPEIWEVILTGGDPLMLAPRRLGRADRGARRHRACRGDPRAQPRADRRSRPRHRRTGGRTQAAPRRPVARCALQPRPRARRPRRAAALAGWPMPAYLCWARPCCWPA